MDTAYIVELYTGDYNKKLCVTYSEEAAWNYIYDHITKNIDSLSEKEKKYIRVKINLYSKLVIVYTDGLLFEFDDEGLPLPEFYVCAIDKAPIYRYINMENNTFYTSFNEII